MKNLKCMLALSGMLLFSLSTLYAQPRTGAPRPGERMEKLESAKIAFLTQKLDLNSKEAEKFWPIYNQYQDEMKALAKERMAERKAGNQVSADEQLNNKLEMETQLLELRKKYTREFTRVISSEKVVRLYEAEKEFRQELIKRMQERRQQKP